MLNDGVLWMENSDGIITAVNHQTDIEKKLRIELIAKDKIFLHAALKNFETPTYKIKTKTSLIRIDELTNHKYRFALWKLGEKESSEPDIIIKNGKLLSSLVDVRCILSFLSFLSVGFWRSVRSGGIPWLPW